MKFIRAVLSFLLVIVLLVLSLTAGLLFSLRQAYSEKNIRNQLSSVNWAEFEIPYEEGTKPLGDIVNELISPLEILSVSDETINQTIAFSEADIVISDYISGLLSWFFHNTARPQLEPERISDVILKGSEYILLHADFEETTNPFGDEIDLSFLAELLPEGSVIPENFNNPSWLDAIRTQLKGQLTEAISSLPELRSAIHDIDLALDEIEPYKEYFSFDTLRSLVVMVIAAALLLILINIKATYLGLPSLGISFLLSGTVLIALNKASERIPQEFFTENQIPENIFHLAADPLLSSVGTTGIFFAAGGVCLLIVGILIGSERKESRKENIN